VGDNRFGVELVRVVVAFREKGPREQRRVGSKPFAWGRKDTGVRVLLPKISIYKWENVAIEDLVSCSLDIVVVASLSSGRADPET
jgi:hypothetical protein